MKPILRITILLVVVSLLMSACNQTQQVSSSELQTLVAQTVGAMHTEVAEQPTATMVVPTLLPTFTPIPTLAPTETPIPPTATSSPSLQVGEVDSLTIPAWTVVKGGQTFVKKWRIYNSGTAAWNSDYRIVYISGDKLGISSITLGKIVNPGAFYDVSVTFTAPTAAGSHTTNFMMETESGYRFGQGANSGGAWSVQIKVENVFYVTAASLAASPTSYSGTCPSSITFTPTISVNGSGQVTYYIKFSNGYSDTYSLNFTDSGSASGSAISWPIDSSMTSLTANIYIDNPNHQDFGSVTVSITCTP